MNLDVRPVVDNEVLSITERERREMTGLGAAIYGGFFALAALWLFLTSDYAGFARRSDDGAAQWPERSNSTNIAADSEGSSPRLVSHSASK
jgi:hypothetical protein